MHLNLGQFLLTPALRMNLAIALLLGNIVSLLGEVSSLQEDRHLCTLLGAAISYFYTAAAFLLACEAHACFKAITGGIIGGRAMVYLPVGWGAPAIALGYNVFTSLMMMGEVLFHLVGFRHVLYSSGPQVYGWLAERGQVELLPASAGGSSTGFPAHGLSFSQLSHILPTLSHGVLSFWYFFVWFSIFLLFP